MSATPELRKALSQRQLTMIAIGGVIGAGLFVAGAGVSVWHGIVSLSCPAPQAFSRRDGVVRRPGTLVAGQQPQRRGNPHGAPQADTDAHVRRCGTDEAPRDEPHQHHRDSGDDDARARSPG